MIRVQVRPNEPLEAALRRFKRQCNYAGIFRLAKKHAYHEKSSDKKRRARPGKSTDRRNDQPDFDPLTADTTLDRKAATEAGNMPPATPGESTDA